MSDEDLPRSDGADAVPDPGPTIVEGMELAAAQDDAAAAAPGVVAKAASAVATAAAATTETVVAATQQAASVVATAAASTTETVVAATQQATATVAQATQVATKQVVQTAQTAQAGLQAVGQRATVSPRKAVYRGRRFAAGFAVGVMVLAFLAALAKRYHILPADVGIAKALQKPNFKPYDLLMQLTSELGWQLPSVITRTTFSGVMWAAGFRMEGAATASTFSADLVTMIIKRYVHRPRPTPDLVRRVHNLGETSFPSGHVVHYVTFYGFLFYLFFTHLKNGRGRNALLTLLAIIVLMVGPSRVYMGAHWPSDVAAAYLVGSLWLSVEIIAYLEMKSRFQMLGHWPFLSKRAKPIE